MNKLVRFAAGSAGAGLGLFAASLVVYYFKTGNYCTCTVITRMNNLSITNINCNMVKVVIRTITY